MDVRIGVIHTVKEIDVELPADADRDKIKKKIDAALADADTILWLTDRSGADLAVPGRQDRLHRAGRPRRRGGSASAPADPPALHMAGAR